MVFCVSNLFAHLDLRWLFVCDISMLPLLAYFFLYHVHLLVRWPDQGTPQNFGETILLHFLIYMMFLSKNQEGVEV